MKNEAVQYNKNWQLKLLEQDRFYMQERVLRTFCNLFLKILKSDFGGKILDVGSGDGSFVKVCQENKISAVGIDISDGIDFETDRLPFEDGYFDVAIMYSVLEHLHSPGNILQEIYRVLKKEGKLIIITHNFELENLILCDRKFYSDPTHVRPYSRKSIKVLMKIYDFKVCFVGLWTVCKSHLIWKLPEIVQFYYGAFLPFYGINRYVPNFLKGRSKGMLCVFEK